MDNTVVWEFTHKQMDWQLGMSCDEQLGIPRFPLYDKILPRFLFFFHRYYCLFIKSFRHVFLSGFLKESHRVNWMNN